MQISDLLQIGRGVTALIGGGGKTTLLYHLAEELRKKGTVILATSTRIYPPQQYALVMDGEEAVLRRALKEYGVVAVGTINEEGKLRAPVFSFEELATFADYVLVEADGAKCRPLKAHASHEPVIPDNAQRVVLVVGADGFGKPIEEVCHRPELYAPRCGAAAEDAVTAELAAKVILAEGYGDRVYVNKVEAAQDYDRAMHLAQLLRCPRCGGEFTSGGVCMLAMIRGAGDLASGIALRLYHSGFDVVMTDLAAPMAIRRTVAFSEAVVHGLTTVEDITARRAETVQQAKECCAAGEIPVLVDPEAALCRELKPDVLVDAILAKRNLGTKITDAPVVIGVGPGFTAKVDCHAVVETMRGHTLGRVIYDGSALPNTNIPGLIGGFAGERVLRAPADGFFVGCREIGEMVCSGDIVGHVADEPMRCTIDGVLRGLIATGTEVKCGMKCGDVDPRGEIEYCYTVSDKALAVGGGVLEAALHLTNILKFK